MIFNCMDISIEGVHKHQIYVQEQTVGMDTCASEKLPWAKNQEKNSEGNLPEIRWKPYQNMGKYCVYVFSKGIFYSFVIHVF